MYSVELPSKKELLLVELPPRFRSQIWIKRGGYVVIDPSAFEGRENKLGGEIVNVVRDEKQWRKQAYWLVVCSEAGTQLTHQGLLNSQRSLHISRTVATKSRQWARCHQLKSRILASERGNYPHFQHMLQSRSSCSCSTGGLAFMKSSRLPTQTPSTCKATQPTTAIELMLVLGYTFHAHSCAAQTAYVATGCSPLAWRRKGVDQAIYA